MGEVGRAVFGVYHGLYVDSQDIREGVLGLGVLGRGWEAQEQSTRACQGMQVPIWEDDYGLRTGDPRIHDRG